MKKILIVMILVACGGAAEDETLKSASKIHNVVMKKAHDVSLKVSELKRGETLLTESQRDSLHSIFTSLSEWYDTVVEVPGYEHDEHDHEGHGHDEHDHGEHDHVGHDHGGHDHDHGSEVNYLEGLSSEDILEIQQT